MKGGKKLDELKEFRKSLNLTTNEMAEEIKVSKSLYEKVEMGARKPKLLISSFRQ